MASESVVKTNLVANPGFEDAVESDASGPPGWEVTMMEDGDTWSIDRELQSEGECSLRFDLEKQGSAAQSVKLPTDDVVGKTIKLNADVCRKGGVMPVIMLVGTYSDNVMGLAQIAISQGVEGRFRSYETRFVPTAPMRDLRLMVSAAGPSGGQVWFDNLSVQIES